MTSDPKAPGAAAVYLNIQEVTDDPLHVRSYYARVKVLQEKGKELATVEIPYQRGNFKVTDIKGRTIHPDGTVIPLTGKPEDLLTSRGSDQKLGRMVFNLPSVEVGSILEYSYRLRYDDDHYSSPFWRIQQPYYVHTAHYAFTPFKAFLKGTQNQTSHFLVDSRGNAVNTLIWWSILPQGAKIDSDAVGRFSLDVSDIPAIPDEDWMPPMQTFLYQVLFYYQSAFNGADYWKSEATRWSKDVDHFAEPTKKIREAVAGIVSPSDSDLDKAKKLYKAVQALDNTDFSRAKGKAELKQLGFHVARRAEDTWAQKSGSSEDVALLYLAMLRSLGLPAYAMKVVDRNRSIFTPGYLNFDQLDDVVVILSIGGKEMMLDPGEKMCPFGLLHWEHAGASGIRQSAKGSAISTVPLQPYAANSLTRVGNLTLDGSGGVSGSLSIIMTGQDALLWRQTALENDPDEVKKSFDRWLQEMMPQGVEGHIDHFLGLDDENANLMAMVKLKGVIGTATSKRLLIPGFFFQTRDRQPFVEEAKRIEPVDMHYGEEISDEMVYQLPQGFAVEGAPQKDEIPWEKQAVYASAAKTDAGQVTIEREFLRGFTMVSATEYPSLREFYRKIAAADQQQLVLIASAPTKGH